MVAAPRRGRSPRGPPSAGPKDPLRVGSFGNHRAKRGSASLGSHRTTRVQLRMNPVGSFAGEMFVLSLQPDAACGRRQCACGHFGIGWISAGPFVRQADLSRVSGSFAALPRPLGRGKNGSLSFSSGHGTKVWFHGRLCRPPRSAERVRLRGSDEHLSRE